MIYVLFYCLASGPYGAIACKPLLGFQTRTECLVSARATARRAFLLQNGGTFECLPEWVI